MNMNQDLMAFTQETISLKIKDEAYVVNLDEYADLDTHQVALFCNKRELVYFNSFSVEHVPDVIKKFDQNKNIIAKIFRVQANNSVMCSYFGILIDFRVAGKKLTDFTNSSALFQR